MEGSTLSLRCDGGVRTRHGRFSRRGPRDDGPADRRTTSTAVARAQAGDRDAMRYLYERYADNVYGFVWSILHDDHDAEDVTQQVFAKLLRILPKYEERSVPFLAWVLTVARNMAMDHLRQRRPLPCETLVERGTSDSTESFVLRDAIASLPDDQREVIVLRHVCGMTPGEIADRLGRSEPSVHGLHHRGRGALRALLEQMGAAPTVMTT